jgi:hypothetical protein
MTILTITPAAAVLTRANRVPASRRGLRSLAVATLALGAAGAGALVAANGGSGDASASACRRAAVAWPSGDAASPPAWPDPAAAASIDMFALAGPATAWPSSAGPTAAWPSGQQPLPCL